jgi:zeaxanthin glucosyltransferase
MGVIIFKASPIASHYNATFKIGHALKNEYGHEVIYIGNDSFSDNVEANGFRYISIGPSYKKMPSLGIMAIWPHTSMEKGKSFLAKLLIRLAHKRSTYRSIKNRIQAINEEEIERFFQSIKPDLVLLDTFYFYEVPFLYKYNIPFAIYQTKFSTIKETGLPPLTSRHVPTESKLNQIYCEFLWLLTYQASFFRKLISKMISVNGDDYSEFSASLKKMSFPRNDIKLKRIFNPGFTNYWEFILSPLDFDFKRKKNPFQIAMGPCVDMTRKETDFDYRFLGFKKKNLVSIKRDNKKIVYCSLGSIPDTHSKYCLNFYRNLVSCAKKNKNLVLVLAVGLQHSEPDFLGLEAINNIFIFQKVPQLDILKYCDLMITHGGMQSLTECIYSEVPMIVYPLNSRWDQNGNSSRVVYHKIGLRGNLRWDSERRIARKIEKVLFDVDFKSNLKLLKTKIDKSDNFKLGVRFLDALSKRQQPLNPSVHRF